MTTPLTRPKPACADDPEAWFSDDPAVQEECKAVCAGCPIAAACFAGAVERGEQWGVWAGVVFGPTFEMAGPDEPWLRPQVFAPAHGENKYFEKCTAGVGGSRCTDCKRAHAEYVQSQRLKHKWTTAVDPDSCPERLQLFDPAIVTTIGRISA